MAPVIIDLENRPQITVILAMSADGKIADFTRAPAKFGSASDKLHLETQMAAVDGVMFGRGTLDAYGTTLRIQTPQLLQQRRDQGKPPQPVHILCSASSQIDHNLPFFTQPIPRWLLQGRRDDNITEPSISTDLPQFEKVLTVTTDHQGNFQWEQVLPILKDLGIQRLAVLGGGHLVNSLLQTQSIDEFWLTICPLILGGDTAPTPVDGSGFLASLAPRLELLTVKTVDQEVFLHYRTVNR